MKLPSGSRLGPYEVLAPIGAGGMGEVYRARDPRLGRDVAIKVLPASLSNDPDRLKRFEQEARAAGVLNHPNVTIVYDIGQHNGAPYVVQELLEGETLRAELASGRFSPRKAIDYAIQVAQGLAAAHEKGIVHRDLKPENVFVTRDGRVKILDFGLAKLTQTEGAGNATNIPTATEPGVVMGTLGYMSPEQIKAKPADERSDIFALGAILYEMLSGQRAFRGDSAGETMAAILKEDPPDLSVTNQKISPGLERIVRHCLEKNPERRFQSASDLAFDLEALSGSSGPAVPGRAARPRIRLLWPVLALLAALTGTAAGVLWMSAHRPEPASYRQLTFRRGQITNARFAPDGQAVVYSARFSENSLRLYSLRPGSPQSSPLNLEPADLLSVARSGELAVLVDSGVDQELTQGSTLARVPMSGGSPRVLLDVVGQADWAPDGERLAVAHFVEGHGRLEFPVGKVLYESSDSVAWPRVSPRGDLVAFADHPISEETGGSIMLVGPSSKARTLSGGWFDLGTLAWAPGGREIWFSASRTGSRRSLWAVDLSGRLRPLDEVPGSIDILDISPSGRVLIKQVTWRAYLSGIPPGETAARDFTWFDFTMPRDLSDDGKTLLFQEWGEGGGTKGAVYLRRTDGSPPVHLGEGFAMSLSPDQKWVLARLYTTPPRLVLLPTGAGEPKPVPTGDLFVHWGTFFPDGKRLLLVARAKGENAFFALDLSGSTARRVAPTRSVLAARGVSGGLISPDGRFFARRGPADETLLLSLETGEERPAAGIEPDEELVRWSQDGQSLFVAARRGTANVFSRVDPLTGKREPWKEIQISTDLVGLRGGTGPLRMTADGKSIFWGYQRYNDELYLVDGLK